MDNSLQKILKTYNNSFEIARKYYLIVFELNNLDVSKTELDMIAYSAVHGTISSPPIRDGFMKEFNVPEGSIYNMICKLKKKNILYKDKDKKTRINPTILPDFTKDNLILAIKLSLNGN